MNVRVECGCHGIGACRMEVVVMKREMVQFESIHSSIEYVLTNIKPSCPQPGTSSSHVDHLRSPLHRLLSRSG